MVQGWNGVDPPTIAITAGASIVSMVTQVTLNFTSVAKSDIEQVRQLAARNDCPVVLHKPFVPAHNKKFKTKIDRNLAQIRQTLEQSGVTVVLSEPPENLYEISEKRQQPPETDVVPVVLSVSMYLTSIPIVVVLRILYRVTGNDRYASIENQLLDAIHQWSTFSEQSERDMELIVAALMSDIQSINERTDSESEPIVVTAPDIVDLQ